MAIRKKADRFVLEFQQRGVRVFRRLPPGVTKAQAQEYETKLRREIFDGELGKREDLTLPAAIGLWLQNNRRKNQRQAESEARQWEPFVAGRLLREAPEVAQEAIATWCHNATPSPKSRAVGPELATAFGAPSSARALHKRRDGPKKDRRPWTDSLSRAVRVTDATAPATVNRRLALIKAVCKHAWRQGLIDVNLSGRIPLLREDNKREVYLGYYDTPAEAAAAYAGASIVLRGEYALRLSREPRPDGLLMGSAGAPDPS